MDNLRIRLNHYIQQYGSTSVFIAKSLGISESHISRFRRGERNLGKRHSTNLDLLLKSLT